MTVPNSRSLSAEHNRHDRLLVARFAAGDLEGNLQHEAQDLVRRCSECAALAADITAISKAVAKLPSAPRTKDFRLTADQADHLRGSRIDRWLRTITGAGWATVRPVAAVALSVGLVMSAVGALPLLSAGAAASPTDVLQLEQGPVVADGGPTSAPTSDGRSGGPTSLVSAPPPGQNQTNPEGGFASAGDNIDNAYVQATATATDAGVAVAPQPQPTSGKNTIGGDLTTRLPGTTSTPISGILLAGIAVTVLALAAIVALFAVRRRYYDPLLR
jgi:hypothetical protein